MKGKVYATKIYHSVDDKTCKNLNIALDKDL